MKKKGSSQSAPMAQPTQNITHENLLILPVAERQINSTGIEIAMTRSIQ